MFVNPKVPHPWGDQRISCVSVSPFCEESICTHKTHSLSYDCCGPRSRLVGFLLQGLFKRLQLRCQLLKAWLTSELCGSLLVASLLEPSLTRLLQPSRSCDFWWLLIAGLTTSLWQRRLMLTCLPLRCATQPLPCTVCTLPSHSATTRKLAHSA